MLVGEIFHRDFNNRRQLASYVGYALSPFQSGNVGMSQIAAGLIDASHKPGEFDPCGSRLLAVCQLLLMPWSHACIAPGTLVVEDDRLS